VRSICAVREVRSYRLYALTCAHVFVLARGWIITTAGDTRLNTPTIVTTDTDHRRVSIARVISVTILPLDAGDSIRGLQYIDNVADDAKKMRRRMVKNDKKNF